MTYLRIRAAAVIEVPTHKDLIAAWRLYGGPLSVVGEFVVNKPLTATQLHRLPNELRDRLRTEAS